MVDIRNILNKYLFLNWSIVDQVFVSGGNFFTIVLCANFLPIVEQGKLGYIYAWYIGTIILNVSLLFQHASVKAPTEKNKINYRSRLVILQIGIAIVSSVFIAIIVLLLSGIKGLSLTVPEIIIMAIFLCFQQIADFSRRAAYIFETAKVSAKLSGIQYLLRILLLSIIAPTELSSVLLIFILTSIWSVKKTLIIFFQSISLFISIKQFISVHVSESRWFIASGPVMWFCTSIPIFLLGIFVDATAIAVFFSMRSLSNIGNVAMELLETEFAARLGRYRLVENDKTKKSIKIVRNIGLLFWLLGLILIVILGELIVGIVFGEIYKEFSWLLLILWFSNGIVFLYRLNGIHLRTYDKSSVVTKSYLISMVIMLITGVPIIILYGLYGGVWLVVLGAFVILLSQYLLSRSYKLVI